MITPNIDRPDLPPALVAAVELWGQEGKHHWIPVTGGSMFPVMRDGDRVLVSHHFAEIQPGDVIVFWQNGRLVIHRAIRVSGDASHRVILTKGDRAREFDSPIIARELVGKVIAIERGGRRNSTDTIIWRVMGRLIAITEAVGAWLVDRGVDSKGILLGARPNRATTLLRQSIAMAVTCVARALAAVLRRLSE